MAKTLQFRRDTTANLASVTGAVGEIFIDTTKKTVVVMDGSTAGGFPLELEGAGTGATGAAGANGATGAAGANGATGAAGADGATGAAGTNGATGAAGADGATGSQGASGSTGLTGATGSQGIQGASGVTGATGVKGEQGNFGGAAFEYVYDSSSTADSDPGTGRVKFSNTTFSSASFMYINETDFNSLTATSFIETIDDSTSNIKGHFSIADKTDPLVYSLFTITGAHTKSGSYYKIPVGYVSGDTTITDETNTVITFQRTGDKGDTGLTGATGASGINGATGAIGSTGPAGTDGATGAAGSNGTDGATGPAGTNGTNGASGAAGTNGASGATGAAGSNGTDGATGPQGASGVAGASGVGSSLGATSSVSIANLQVGTGATGATGSINASTYIRVGFAPGATGFVGATGSLSAIDAYFSSVRVNGVTLTSGATGVAGSAGDAGATGPQGASGSQGLTGASGPQSGYLNGPISGFSLLIGATGVLNTGATGQGWFGSALYVGSQGATGVAWGASGTIRATGDITAFYSSDRTLKENIQDIPGALDKVVAIGGKTFDWTDEYIADHGGADGYFVNKADFGVIAQDVQDVFPVAVRLRDNGKLAVDYDKLVALAFAAIKELKAQLDAK